MCGTRRSNAILGFCRFCNQPSIQQRVEAGCWVSATDNYGKKTKGIHEIMLQDGTIKDLGGPDAKDFIVQDDWECQYGGNPPFPEEYPPQPQMPLTIQWVPGWNGSSRSIGYVETGPPWDRTQPCMRCYNEKEFWYYWQHLMHLVEGKYHGDLQIWLASYKLGSISRPKIPELDPQQLYRRSRLNEWYASWCAAKGLDPTSPLDEHQLAKYLRFQERRRLLNKDAPLPPAPWVTQSDEEDDASSNEASSREPGTEGSLSTTGDSTYSQRRQKRRDQAINWHVQNRRALRPPTLYDDWEPVPGLGTIGHGNWGRADMSKDNQESYAAARRIRPYPTRQSTPRNFHHLKEGQDTREHVEMEHNLRVRHRMFKAKQWTEPEHALPALLPKEQALFAIEHGPFVREQPFRAAWSKKTAKEAAERARQEAIEKARPRPLAPFEQQAQETARNRRVMKLIDDEFDPGDQPDEDDEEHYDADSEATEEPSGKDKHVVRRSMPVRSRRDSPQSVATAPSQSEASSHASEYEPSMSGTGYSEDRTDHVDEPRGRRRRSAGDDGDDSSSSSSGRTTVAAGRRR